MPKRKLQNKGIRGIRISNPDQFHVLMLMV